MYKRPWSFNYSLYSLHRESIDHNKGNFNKVKMKKKDGKSLKASYRNIDQRMKLVNGVLFRKCYLYEKSTVFIESWLKYLYVYQEFKHFFLSKSHLSLAHSQAGVHG